MDEHEQTKNEFQEICNDIARDNGLPALRVSGATISPDAVDSLPLLTGIDALTKPDYAALNRRGERLLHAVLCAYAKHGMDHPDIGWEQLRDILQDAICEAIGDAAFCDWTERTAPDTGGDDDN